MSTKTEIYLFYTINSPYFLFPFLSFPSPFLSPPPFFLHSKRITIQEIKRHPFYLSRTFNPPKSFLPVGERVGECERVKSGDVDEEILLSLMSLGFGQDDEEVK